jgi:hypothetical protein
MEKDDKALTKTDEAEDNETEPEQPETVIPDEVLEKLPPEARGEFKRLFSMVSAGYIGPPPSPFARKLTSDHITKIIDNNEKEDQRQFNNAKDERKMSLTIFFGILVPVTGLIVFLH